MNVKIVEKNSWEKKTDINYVRVYCPLYMGSLSVSLSVSLGGREMELVRRITSEKG